MSTSAASAAKTTTDAEAPEVPTKQFNVFAQEHRGGGMHNELSEKLAELTAAVLQYQKKGSLTLKLEVKPAEGAAVAVLVTDSIESKVPKAGNPPSLFFSDTAGNLSRRDPRQMEVPGLREAKAT